MLAAQPALHVATKCGFLGPSELRDAVRDRVVDDREAAARHSISASYILWQTERSRAALGRGQLDVVYVHNPERTVRPKALREDLRSAFIALEELAAVGHLVGYGVATWDGFDRGAFDVALLDKLATEAAGTREHHLRAIQLPVNLVNATAFSEALDGRGPILAASWLGWDVHASAPLHGGELPNLATRELTDLILPGADITTACLAAVASCPGVSKVLLSTGKSAHWSQAHTAVREQVPAIHLRKVLDVLATPV